MFVCFFLLFFVLFFVLFVLFLLLFFAFHFSKPLKFVLGLPKWEFSTGKKHFTPGKNKIDDGGSKPSKSDGRGVVPPGNILSRHFEKYIYHRNTISLLYKQKTV